MTESENRGMEEKDEQEEKTQETETFLIPSMEKDCPSKCGR